MTGENYGFRDAHFAKQIVQKIKNLTVKNDKVKICHVCGTHEWTITHYGLRSLLPPEIEVIAGPGCPVCVVPAAEIDQALQLAQRGISITCFGDVLRVPGSESSLLDAKANGADVRIVYAVSDAIEMARREPKKQFAFFAVGFETTAPSTAIETLENPPKNFSFLASHRLIPPAMEMLLSVEDLKVNGFIAPGHVSAIIGLKPYEVFPKKYKMPTVIAGFEPNDVLMSIYMLIQQVSQNKAQLENEYTRVVKPEGNPKALEAMTRAFEVSAGNWRGMGKLEKSALLLKEKYANFDARIKFDIQNSEGKDIPQNCQCHRVIIGKIKPDQCPMFLKTCTPAKPIGACMVSNEGTCRVWAKTVNQ
ncbi:MAG: hydrogenase formation protein HypD [Nitrososphaerota archaeon]|jgi:hydrogenase expression/formation protein HypD|nr:hydrogenase formation protein HypD [Nitrososphaerota archaeon]